jgi:hypothetical protein
MEKTNEKRMEDTKSNGTKKFILQTVSYELSMSTLRRGMWVSLITLNTLFLACLREGLEKGLTAACFSLFVQLLAINGYSFATSLGVVMRGKPVLERD